jgi:hypothetical protein
MKTVFFLSLVVCLASSCRKLEEIKKYSLLSNHDRMSKDWKLISKTENKSAIDLTGFDIRLALKKDNTYFMSTSYQLFSQTIKVERKGTWFFSHDNKSLQLCEALTNKTEIFTIVLLKKGELQLQQVSTNEVLNRAQSTKLYCYKAK